MTPEQAQALLAPFKSEEIGKLPRVTCGACSKGRCDNQSHAKQRCSTCKAYVSSQHIHLDYVGHADVTHRLVTVDPEWSWEPRAQDQRGLPLFDLDADGHPVGLWINLTVCGVTRLGYGSCPGNQTDAVKVLIGDALRNAAMRFGVAWDLWAKGDRSDPSGENATGAPSPAQRNRRPDPPTKAAESTEEGLRAAKLDIVRVARTLGLDSVPAIDADYGEWSRGSSIGDADETSLRSYLETLERRVADAA